MATFRKRGDSIRVQVCVNGVRDSATRPSMAEARAWARTRETELNDEASGVIPDKTFGELLARYRDEVSPRKKGAREEATRINKILGNDDPLEGPLKEGDPIASVKLKNLDGTYVARWRDRCLQAGLRGSSVSREWNLYSAACSVAIAEWKWLRFNPFGKSAGVRRPPPPPHRDEVILEADLAALQAAAEAHATPTYLRVMRVARFGMETGMRAGEIIFVGANPERVDTEARVASLPDSKNGSKRRIPLSPEAIRLWEEAVADTPKGIDNVWGLNSSTLDVHWRALRELAADRRELVARLHFHDTRHTAATNIAKKLQVLDLCRMFGWRDPKRAMIYYNETAESIALKL